VHCRGQGFVSDQGEFVDPIISEAWAFFTSKGWDSTRSCEVNDLFKFC
jgi:hypothetical protein